MKIGLLLCRQTQESLSNTDKDEYTYICIKLLSKRKVHKFFNKFIINNNDSKYSI